MIIGQCGMAVCAPRRLWTAQVFDAWSVCLGFRRHEIRGVQTFTLSLLLSAYSVLSISTLGHMDSVHSIDLGVCVCLCV